MISFQTKKSLVLCLTAFVCWAGLTLLFMVRTGAFQTEHDPLQTPPTLEQAFVQSSLLAVLSMVGFLVLVLSLVYIFRFLQLTFRPKS